MQGLLVQCPHCLHLVRLGNGVLNNNTVCFECTSCHSNIALPYQNDTHAPNTQKAHPHPIALHEDTVLPEIPESHLRALKPKMKKPLNHPNIRSQTPWCNKSLQLTLTGPEALELKMLFRGFGKNNGMTAAPMKVSYKRQITKMHCL